MIYKKTPREKALLFCSIILVYGVVLCIVYNSVVKGILGGLLYGGFFVFCMAVVSISNEGEAKTYHTEISRTKKIICEGPVKRLDMTYRDGWLFLCEDVLVFYPRRIRNEGRKKFLIRIQDIENIETKSNKLIIHTKAGDTKTYVFAVSKIALLKHSIMEQL